MGFVHDVILSSMTTTKEFSNLEIERTTGLFPIIQIRLYGKSDLNSIIEMLLHEFKITCRLIKADIQYIDGNQYGDILLLFKCDSEVTTHILKQLDRQQIDNSITGYAA